MSSNLRIRKTFQILCIFFYIQNIYGGAEAHDLGEMVSAATRAVQTYTGMLDSSISWTDLRGTMKNLNENPSIFTIILIQLYHQPLKDILRHAK